ncbi:MAG: response regulator transcription factor [Lachnospiraceae bacterium]|nr:response regulator transcription factor [Lachnospiraceae bacterium]
MGTSLKTDESYTVLVVDDDPNIVNIIQTDLEQAGLQVVSASDGEAACILVASIHPDLVIMDIMMPRINGLMATMRIREDNNVPILMLSAKAEGSDRVLGLEVGADDYLVKPFYKQELLARVKALLRRYDKLGSIRESVSDDMIRVGDIVLDTAKKQLLVRGEYIHLTATEYGILNVLMSNPGRVYSAEDIYSRVWDGESFSVENTVMVHIRRIREKFEINPKKPEHLKVIWGIGYVFE